MITQSGFNFFIVFILLVYMCHRVVILRFCNKTFYKEIEISRLNVSFAESSSLKLFLPGTFRFL